MNDVKRDKKCKRCKARKSQEVFMNQYFDWRNCPYICVEQKLYSKSKGVTRI